MEKQQFAKPEAVTITIEDIVNDVRAGRIRIPKFQRGFRWDAKDVERLLDSIRLGYPIGSLLLWKRAAAKAQVDFGGLRFEAPERPDALWVVDGQQRITSLANVLIGDSNQADKRFSWSFDLADAQFVQRSRATDSAVPLSTIFQLEALLEWVRQLDPPRAQLDNAYSLARAIREYKVPAYIVAGEDEVKLRDIFDRMNNYGRRLGRAEVFHALHGGSGDSMGSLRDIADFVDNDLGFGRVDEATLMSAVLARRGANVFREVRQEFRDVSGQSEFPGEKESEAFANGAQALSNAITFLRNDAYVPHFGFLAYRYLLVVLARFFGHFPTPKRRNRELLRRWYWRAALLGPEPMKGWTQTLSRFNAKIVPGDENLSVQNLLRVIGDVKKNRPIGIDDLNEVFRFTSARSRVILCALWSRKPRRSSLEGSPYTIPDGEQTLLGLSTARRATVALLPRYAPANLFLALEGDDQSVLETRLASEPTSEWLHSHCLDEEAAHLWKSGDVEAFLRRRESLLTELVKLFVARQAEWDFEDTPPIDSIFLDDGGDGEDESI